MQLPRSVVIGHDVLPEVGVVCKELNLKESSVAISGPTTRKIAGDMVLEYLNDDKYDVEMVELKTKTNPGIKDELEEIKSLALEIDAKFMLGIGGGRIIDISKSISSQIGIPFLSIPTAASHDGIASFISSIGKNGENQSVFAQAPLGIIADTKIISSAPKRLMAAGCGDIIANYTAVKDWQLAKKLRNANYSEYAAALSQMTARIISNNANTIKSGLEESVRIVIKALVSSGVAMSIAGESSPCSGSEHKFSHALDSIAKKRALHGEQCGVGAIMMMYLHGGDWISIKSSLAKVGAPTNAKELGIREEEIIEALVHAHEIRPERYTILGPGLTWKAAENLARETCVI
jgi:glycerol-1-phosphate dehydrogenase [NAD(P)+]